ncbi:hypothetical protein Acsp04_47420 [Actinomadura sp. NBRC 104425]|nr:hypothetical protein Acsp04_47420 [Actinomadura sp. NBRC 104425]
MMAVVLGSGDLAGACGAVRAWTGHAASEAAWHGSEAQANGGHGVVAPWFQPSWPWAWESALGQASAGPVGMLPGVRRSDRPARELRCGAARVVGRRIVAGVSVFKHELYGVGWGLRARAEEDFRLGSSVGGGGTWA